jgi:uncharacterized FlaG/YvyC family protein
MHAFIIYLKNRKMKFVEELNKQSKISEERHVQLRKQTDEKFNEVTQKLNSFNEKINERLDSVNFTFKLKFNYFVIKENTI